MPKIVDHQSYREDLARRAAGLFSEYGYSGLGMRAIAEGLGISKSALYHYFPSKRDLFLACTAVVTAPPAAGELPKEPVEALLALSAALRPDFGAEMSLLFDYLRGMRPDEIAADPAMRLSLEAFRAQIATIAGEAHADALLALLTGALLLDHFSGGAWSPEALRPALARLLTTGELDK